MIVDVLTEVLFGFGVVICIAFVSWGFRIAFRAFEIASDMEE